MTRPEGCGFGPCKDSLERGGQGCRLCDVIAKLPQPTFKSRDALVEDESPDPLALDVEPDFPAAPAPVRKPVMTVSKVAAPVTKKRALKGPQSGSLL